MLTYTTSLSHYQRITENSSSGNTTYFDIIFNEKIREILAKRKWPFAEKTPEDIDTVADQQFYDQPFNTRDINTVSVTVSSTKYTPLRCPDIDFWDKLNMVSQSSDTPSHWFIKNGQIGLYPIPATASNTITVNYKKRVKDLSVADYTTGDLTNTNGSKVITGSGTTFTVAMVGRWIKLGDGQWYEIDSFTSTTVIGLVNNFEGTTAGTISYTIGEISILPEEYQLLPIYGAVADYFLKEKDIVQSDRYEAKFNNGIASMERDLIFMVSNPVIESGEENFIQNPNLHITI